MNRARVTNRVLRGLAPLGLLIALLLGLAGTASAQKVGNPGTFNFKVDSGLMQVKTQSFPFDDAQGINFNGTVDKNGNISIPTMIFPDFPMEVSGQSIVVKINVVGPTLGTVNPLTGAASLTLKVWIKIDGSVMGSCRIASAGSPVVVPLTTGSSQEPGSPLIKTGVPYNPGTGKLTLVNATFSAPGATDCGPFGSLNGTVNDAVGLPSPAGSNAAEFNITTTPVITRAINPALTATPSTGTAPLVVDLNAAASTVVATPVTYRWDFTNDGTIDQTTSVPTVPHTYTTGGNHTARVEVVDKDGDFLSATAPVTVKAYPDLALTAAHTGSFGVGNLKTYRINLANQGYADTTGPVTVSSTLPAGLSFDSVTGAGWGCSASGQDVTCTRSAAIPVSGSAPELGLKVMVGPAAFDQVTPTFTVTSQGTDGPDNNPANDSASDPTDVTGPDLSPNVSHTVHAIMVGNDPANEITLSVTNSGDGPTVTPTTITDVLPAGLTPTGANGTGWSCTVSGQTVACTRAAAIAAGETTPPVTVTVDGSLDQDVAGVWVDNEVTVANAEDVNPANDSATDHTLILSGPDVGITKSHSGTFTAFKPGEYTLTVKNFGPAATTGTITVSDVLPDGLVYVSADGGTDWSCAMALNGDGDEEVTCTHDDPIAAGATAPPIDLKVDVGLEAIPSVDNTATVATLDDPNTENDSFTDVAAVKAIDLTITKSHQGVIHVGKDATYSLAVENIGDSETTDPTTVTDVLPAGLTYVSGTGAGWICSETGGTVTCDHVGTINGGASAADIELTVAVDVAAAPSVTNTATVATQDDYNPANNSSSHTADAVEEDTAVTIGRTGTFRPGKTGTYQVTVRNVGAVATTAVTDVSLELGVGLDLVSATGNGWNCSGSAGTVTCDRPAPLAGDTTAPPIRVEAAVTVGAAPATVSTVTATTAGDRNQANDVASDTAQVATPDLAITATHSGAFRLGDTGVWNLDVTNRGDGATTGPITVTDTVPAGIDIRAHGNGWSCDVTAPTVTCDREAALAPGATAGRIELEVIPRPAALAPGDTNATVSNEVEVSTAHDSNPANDMAADPTDLIAVDAAVAMDGPGEVAAGETASWIVRVENTGDAATRGRVRVTDTLPNGFSAKQSGGTGWECSTHGVTVTCDYGDATTPGELLPELTVRARAGAAAVGTATNAAEVDALGDVIPDNDEATLDTEVTAAPDLAVELQALAPAFRVGGAGSYELRVRNVGAMPAGGPNVARIALPEGASFAGLAHSQGWSCADGGNGEVTCTHTSPIEPDEISALGFRLAFDSKAAAQVRVDATVAQPADPNPDNDAASATTPVNRVDLALSRAKNGDWVSGATGRYRLTVTNQGTAATDAPTTITETLPYGTTLASAEGQGWTCGVNGRVMTCVNPAPIGPGASSELNVSLDISRLATSPARTTSEVATDGDVNPANNTAAELVELTGTGTPVPAVATVLGGKVSSTSSGEITAWVSCPAGATVRCSGTLALKTAGRVKVKKVRKKFRRAKLDLGRAAFRLAPGRTAPVRVQAGKQARAALKLNRKLKAQATATSEGGGSSTARVVIRRAR